jgi:hypothetical protein
VSIRFQADADLKQAIVTGVLRQRPAIDFQGSESVPLAGLDDRSVLELCALNGRVLVSHDVTTMESNFRTFIRTQKSPGLVLIPQTRVAVGRAIECLVLLWEIVTPKEMENRVCLVPSLVIYS